MDREYAALASNLNDTSGDLLWKLTLTSQQILENEDVQKTIASYQEETNPYQKQVYYSQLLDLVSSLTISEADIALFYFFDPSNGEIIYSTLPVDQISNAETLCLYQNGIFKYRGPTSSQSSFLDNPVLILDRKSTLPNGNEIYFSIETGYYSLDSVFRKLSEKSAYVIFTNADDVVLYNSMPESMQKKQNIRNILSGENSSFHTFSETASQGWSTHEDASKHFPELSYVVLTVHTEFEYIQQILRLGAIDYIAKTQFDQENFDQILDRIQAGISKKNHASVSSGNWKESKILYPDMYALLSINAEEEESEFSDFLDSNGISEADVYELQQNIWVFHDTRQTFSFPDTFSHAMLLNVSDVYEMTYAQFGKLLRHYLKDQFFYDYRPLHEVNHKHVYELEETTMITDLSTFDAMKSEWSSLNWIHENELFDQFRATLKNCCLKPSQLYHFLLNLEILWNASYSTTTGETIKLPSSFSNWYEVEQWLLSVYEKAKLFRADSKYSREIVKNILSVQTYIHTNYNKELDATDLARTVGMSYGYFSRCFHDIIGQSFSEYCISVRMKEAQLLLKNTDDSIQSIAFSVGYHDEKYFSRLFKKVTGQSPSEYRKQ